MALTDWTKNQEAVNEAMDKFEEHKKEKTEKKQFEEAKIREQAFKELSEHNTFECEKEKCDLCTWQQPIQVRAIKMHTETEDTYIV